jgi:general L-amino acid transport system permease protein
LRARRLLNDKKVRGWVAQGATLFSIAALLAFFVANASENMARSGIASGFDFLGGRAGLDVSFKLIEYSADSSYARLLLVGICNTLFVSFFGVIFATLLGIAVGVGRLSENWLLSRLCGAFVEAVRNIPLLLFVLVWYYAVLRIFPAPRQSLSIFDTVFLNNRGVFVPTPTQPDVFLVVLAAFAIAIAASWVLGRWALRRQATTGHSFPLLEARLLLVLGLPVAAALAACFATEWQRPVLRGFGMRGGTSVSPEFVALLVALSTYTAGFIAEIVRAGILSVTRGQREAAAALGLHRREILRLVVFPQALRVIIPPLTSQYVNLIKNSSYAAVIAYPELVSVFVGSALNSTGRAIEIIAITLAIYLSINLTVSALMNWYNARVALVGR